MNWLFCIVIAIFADAMRIYIDNYISDYYFKGKLAVAQKYFYCFAFIIIGVICACITGVDFSAVPFHVYLLFILSGAFSVIAGIPYYRSLELSNSTDYGIFMQLSPIIYLILGWIFLGQSITIVQAIAFVIILSAPFLVIMTTRKRSRSIQLKAALYAFAGVLISAIGALIFVQQNTVELNFVTEMAFVFIGKGLGNVVIMAFAPKWRKRYHYVAKTSHQKVLRPLTATFVACLLKDFATNMALILAPSVALVSAISDSSKPIVIFFMGLLFTLICPKFGREKLNKRTIMVHLLATILVVVGICLIQFA